MIVGIFIFCLALFLGFLIGSRDQWLDLNPDFLRAHSQSVQALINSGREISILNCAMDNMARELSRYESKPFPVIKERYIQEILKNHYGIEQLTNKDNV